MENEKIVALAQLARFRGLIASRAEIQGAVDAIIDVLEGESARIDGLNFEIKTMSAGEAYQFIIQHEEEN